MAPPSEKLAGSLGVLRADFGVPAGWGWLCGSP